MSIRHILITTYLSPEHIIQIRTVLKYNAILIWIMNKDLGLILGILRKNLFEFQFS